MASGVVEIPLVGPPLENGSSPFSPEVGSFALPEFVAGPENQLVEVAVASVLDGAAALYNPLVLCGPTGSGKTHLAGGLHHAWKSVHPRRTALLVTGPDFARAFHDAVEMKTEDQFEAAYARAQFLALDNLDALAGAHLVQQALVALVDPLIAAGGWVVVTCRCSPARLPGLLPALRARLTAGLLVRLMLPAVETRMAILDRVARLRRIRVAQTVLRTLAEGLTVPVPELVGALVQLEAESRLGTPLTVDAAERLLAERRQTRRPTLSMIAKATAKHFGLSVSRLRGISRQRATVAARNVAMYVARNVTENSLERIGDYFGNRDHTTVSHGCKRIEAALLSDSGIREAVAEVQARLLLR